MMRRPKKQSVFLIALFLALLVAVGALAYRDARARNTKTEPTVLDAKTPFYFPDAPPASDPEIVYVSPSGGKYHLYADCSFLARAAQVTGVSRAAAVADGKTECTRCRDRFNAQIGK